MPIIQTKKSDDLINLKIRISSELHKEIASYCEKFNITKIDDFLSQAAEYILDKDKDWKKHKGKN